MKSFLSVLFLFTLAATAHADVHATKARNSSGIQSAEVFTLTVTGAKPTAKALAEEVGKRIRQGYYQRSAKIDGWDLAPLPLARAVSSLAKRDGLFQGLTEREQGELSSWIEDKQVRATAYRMTVRGSTYGAEGESVHTIFLPTDTSEPVLTIVYDRAGEE